MNQKLNLSGFINANDILKGEQQPSQPQYYVNNPLNIKLGRVGQQIPEGEAQSPPTSHSQSGQQEAPVRNNSEPTKQAPANNYSAQPHQAQAKTSSEKNTPEPPSNHKKMEFIYNSAHLPTLAKKEAKGIYLRMTGGGEGPPPTGQEARYLKYQFNEFAKMALSNHYESPNSKITPPTHYQKINNIFSSLDLPRPEKDKAWEIYGKMMGDEGDNLPKEEFQNLQKKFNEIHKTATKEFYNKKESKW